jgi:hypothetical protein
VARHQKHRMDGDQTARFRTTPTTAAVMADSAPESGLFVPELFDVGRAHEYPEKARRERMSRAARPERRPGAITFRARGRPP